MQASPSLPPGVNTATGCCLAMNTPTGSRKSGILKEETAIYGSCKASPSQDGIET